MERNRAEDLCVSVPMCWVWVVTSRDNIQPRRTAACSRTQVLHSTHTSHTGNIVSVAQTVRCSVGYGEGVGVSGERELPVLACRNDGRTPPAERPNHTLNQSGKYTLWQTKIHTDVTVELWSKTTINVILRTFTPSIIIFIAQKCQLTLTVIDCVVVEQ